ncbi:MAG: PspC domain-containing protein [Chloroflexi bacterium]|nr:PspC domain-containing protein [Chloroflexota bacterium]
MTNATEPSEGAPPEPPPLAEAPPPAPRPKRLTRSRDEQMISGVAGGIAEYFDLDPVLVRVALVVLAFVSGGAAILGYIVAWIVMPEGDGRATVMAADGSVTEVVAPRRSSGAAAGIVWGLILIGIGGAVLLARLDIRIPEWNAILAGSLIALGVLIIIEARKGMNSGLVTLAVGLSVLLGAAEMVDFRFESGFGDRQTVVTQPADLEESYGHAFGSMTVDLTDLELPEGTTHLAVSVAFGEVVVRLPEGVPYRLNASAVFGSVDAPTFNADGIASSRTFQSSDYDNSSKRLDLDVSTAFGSARIR